MIDIGPQPVARSLHDLDIHSKLNTRQNINNGQEVSVARIPYEINKLDRPITNWIFEMYIFIFFVIQLKITYWVVKSIL